MNGRARLILVACAVALFATAGVRSQVIVQPTAAPIATAENEQWYLNGEPITVDGIVYYPAGAQMHFRANEMVRSGFYRGIPLYTSTVLEPFSAVFVPLPGGLMQPYQRPRAGDVAGTAGSITSPLPTEIAAGDRSGVRTAGTVLQAPAPPTNIGPNVFIPGPERTIEASPIPTASERPVGTTGRFPAAPVRLTVAGERPSGVNAVYIRFRNERWYASGRAVPLGAAAFERVGDYHGFPVYARAGERGVIYVPSTMDAQGLLVPYSTRRER